MNVSQFQRNLINLMAMHIGLLNDPNNFHTQKWGKALVDAGATVTVFSLDEDRASVLPAVRIGSGDYNYRTYLRSGPELMEAMEKAGVDLVNALNITPFGVWASRSGFRPVIASAMGADILEYPPRGVASPNLDLRHWENTDGRNRPVTRFKGRLKRQYFRRKVAGALGSADLITGDNQVLVDAIKDWFRIPADKVRLLRWGIEPELLAPQPERIAALRKQFGIREDHRLVLSPRGAKPIYQADIILEAFAQLLSRGVEDHHFMMLSAGYGISPEVDALASRLEAAHANFTFVREQIPREEVSQLWHLTDVFISAPVYDGYSAALAEGRYAGAIPVVNAIPGNRELMQHGENGWFTDPFTSEQLTNDLIKIFANKKQLQARFQAKNRQWINENSLIGQNADTFLRWADEIMMKKV